MQPITELSIWVQWERELQSILVLFGWVLFGWFGVVALSLFILSSFPLPPPLGFTVLLCFETICSLGWRGTFYLAHAGLLILLHQSFKCLYYMSVCHYVQPEDLFFIHNISLSRKFQAVAVPLSLVNSDHHQNCVRQCLKLLLEALFSTPRASPGIHNSEESELNRELNSGPDTIRDALSCSIWWQTERPTARPWAERERSWTTQP